MSPKNLNVQSKTHRYLFNKLNNKRIFQIYKKFENIFKLKQAFIVAVSGGPDSLALCYLTKIYSLKHSINVKYYLVNHKLRNNSSLEAKFVKRLLKKNLINLNILSWNGKKPSNNIQGIARKKRYQLLTNQANKFKINNILTAHHFDDVFENFFIRILRGSGLKGLVSFDEKTKYQQIKLIRPLISFEKKDLAHIASNVFGTYVNDPSNEQDKFKRVRIRKLIENLKSEGLDRSKFFLTIKNLKLSNETIKFYILKNLDENSSFIKKKNLVILNKSFFKQPHEVVFRSFVEIIKFVGNKYYPARGKKVDKILESINSNKKNLKVTLANCIIKKVNQSIIVTKEQ